MSAPSLSICFITDGEPFHGASPEERALGGSETALVQMARAMSRLGHKVRVFCRCPAPGDYQGVAYHDRADLVRAAGEERFDVLVVSRFFAALDLPMQTGLKVLWNHDILDKPDALAQRLGQIDAALVLSEFHKQDYILSLPACRTKLHVTRNGLDTGLIRSAGQNAARQPGLVTYVSRPERGLKLLLEKIWPPLRQSLPQLRLAICGYQVEQTGIHPAIAKLYAQIEELIQASEGVELLGALAKEDYYRHLASCQALLYPCVFPEISCISALEAQALGTPVITSDSFALAETVLTPEFKASGDPGSPEYVDAFLKISRKALAQPQWALSLAQGAREKTLSQSDWVMIARQWEELFIKLLTDGSLRSGRYLAASLILGGDRRAAARLLKRELPKPESGPAPQDPDEKGLLNELANMAANALRRCPPEAPVGVISADQGRTADSLARILGRPVVELPGGEKPRPKMGLVLIRDRLERAVDPADVIRLGLGWCAEPGYLALCVASGAWPLLGPGHSSREHNLGKEEILALLPGRQVAMAYLHRGLVGREGERFFAGRWLAITPAQGPEPGQIDQAAPLRRVRPATLGLVREVERAGLM